MGRLKVDSETREQIKELKRLIAHGEMLGHLDGVEIPEWTNKAARQYAAIGRWDEALRYLRVNLAAKTVTSKAAGAALLGLDIESLGDPADKLRRKERK